MEKLANMSTVSKAIVLLGGLAFIACGTAAMNHQSAFHSTMVGSNPDMPIAGVGSGTVPWTIDGSTASLEENGQVHVSIRNLIRPDTGNANPVTSVSATLVCGDSVVATTDAVPLSEMGDAEINQELAMPAVCVGPIFLVNIAGLDGAPLPQLGPWIAATGVSG